MTDNDLSKEEVHPNISPLLLPFEDDEGHQSNHHCCQDGAVDGDEFLIQAVVLLTLRASGGGYRGAVHWKLRWHCH